MKEIAIVTGASSGIGREFVLQLAQNYTVDEVWVIARGKEKLEALQADTPLSIRAIPLDLTDSNSMATLAELLQQEEVSVRILCNASGYGKFERFDAIPAEDNLGMIDLNCRALTAITQMVLPYLSEGSIIVNIASIAAFQPIPYGTVYAASKAYVLSFTRALNRELKSRKIRALAVCPYWTRTNFFTRSNERAVITHFDCMYEPSFIIKKTFRAMKKKRKDYVVPGFIAKCTRMLSKITPHKIVMGVFLRQQKLHKK